MNFPVVKFTQFCPIDGKIISRLDTVTGDDVLSVRLRKNTAREQRRCMNALRDEIVKLGAAPPSREIKTEGRRRDGITVEYLSLEVAA